jgi:pimeloyl-ACP methyl ester carboxylesterase
MKETVLMIPGTLCDEALFQHQVNALTTVAHCIVANHSSAADLQQQAQDILNSVEGNFTVMGLSYGGIIAFELWRQAPQRINRMILLNTTHKPPSEKTRALQQTLVAMADSGQFREITSGVLKMLCCTPLMPQSGVATGGIANGPEHRPGGLYQSGKKSVGPARQHTGPAPHSMPDFAYHRQRRQHLHTGDTQRDGGPYSGQHAGNN